MKSLNARLGSGLVIALLAIFLVQWLLVSLVVRDVTEDYIATRITRDVEFLLADLGFDTEGNPVLEQPPQGLYNSGPFSGQYFQISADGRTLRSESIWDETLAVPEVAVGGVVQTRLPGPLEQSLLAVSMGFRKQGHNLVITVAEDISAVDAGIRSFQRQYLVLSFGLLSLLLLSQWWIVRRSLRPLTETRLDLERVSRGETGKLPEDVPLEVRPLVTEINLLLELLSRRLERTRTAIGNLAHQLKLPLSLLTQLGNTDELKQHPQLQQNLLQQTGVIGHALERELGRARLAGDGKSGRRFAPREDIGSLLLVLERVYQDKKLIMEQQIAAAQAWPADQEDMLELFGNLLDNACKWAAVRIRIRIDANRTVTIEDDGPGCPPEQMERLCVRGQRLDESVDGHGLGLSIATDIVSFYKGTLVFSRSVELGGMRVTVAFPLS